MSDKLRPHTRIKPKAGAAPTAEERKHWERIARMGCLVCSDPATIHHVTGSPHGGRVTRKHSRVAPLCPKHHQIIYGPKESVEALGHRGFYRMYGIDLLAWADWQWENSQGAMEEV